MLLLVLPRPDEARAVKDDTGEMVESDDEGYELKRDQQKRHCAGSVWESCQSRSSMRPQMLLTD